MTNHALPSLIFYESFALQFQILSLEDRGRLITAIFQYAFQGQEPQGLSELLQMAFCPIRYMLDRDRDAYLEKCQTNTENGKKGGRPRKNFFDEKTERFSDKTEKPYNKDKDINKNNNKDIYKDRDKDKDKDKDTEPLPAVPAPPTPSLSEQEKESLCKSGVRKKYIEKRLDRAIEYASMHRESVYDVLLRWWKEDGGSVQSISDFPTKSYDLDDFVAAALARSYQGVT